MRIALFTETFIPKVDGIVTTLCQSIKQLNNLGHQVLIFSPDGGFDHFEQSRIVGMKSRSFALYPELRLSLPHASMRAALTEFKPDIIHVVEPALLGIAGLYYGGGENGGALHLPLVISYHTDLPKYLHYYHLSFMEAHVWPILRLRHNRATINLCTSDAMVRQFQEHGIRRVAPICFTRAAVRRKCASAFRRAILRAPCCSVWDAFLPRKTLRASSPFLKPCPMRAWRWLAMVPITRLSSTTSRVSRFS
jgi:glycosyltransferase involved in cell wall biosynthesis